MGKVPPSLRSATTALIRRPAAEQQPHTKHHQISRKPNKSRLSQTTPSQSSKQPKSLINSPCLNEAKSVFASLISNPRIPLDTRYHNTFLESYASIAMVDDSVSLLHHMIKTFPSFSPNHTTFHILLSQSCKSPEDPLAAAHKTLNLMVSEGFKPTQVTVDIAVRSLCSAGHIDDAISLVKEFCLKHSNPDTFTYNFFVKCLCKSRSLSTVYSFIDEMKSSFYIQPGLVTYTILIDNVCNSKNLGEALGLVAVLRKCGFKPDCFVYNTIMKGYCMLSKGSEAIGVYKQMREEGVEPDIVTYNTLIFGLSKSGRMSEAKKFLKVMIESGHIPDAVTYTSLMNGMCREGDALGALALLEEMEGKGCSPNSCTFNTLLLGLCKGRLLDKGLQLFEVMKRGGLKLESASYGTLVRALCREDRAAEAYEVFDYAVESKSLIDVAAYTTLESTLKRLKKAREKALLSNWLLPALAR